MKTKPKIKPKHPAFKKIAENVYLRVKLKWK